MHAFDRLDLRVQTVVGKPRQRAWFSPRVHEIDFGQALENARARFWEKVGKAGADECWEWLAARSAGGYGAFSFRGRPAEAHRVSVLLDGREIPDGMWIDHICRNRGCVNPAHLRVVTPRVNGVENSTSPYAINASRTHCVRGHEFNTVNALYRPNAKGDGFGRYCRICARERAREAYQRRKLRISE